MYVYEALKRTYFFFFFSQYLQLEIHAFDCCVSFIKTVTDALNEIAFVCG